MDNNILGCIFNSKRNFASPNTYDRCSSSDKKKLTLSRCLLLNEATQPEVFQNSLSRRPRFAPNSQCTSRGSQDEEYRPHNKRG